ncbi:MAG TPA: iron ABC transporter permease [Methylomusa anaerophila]|uniref:Hemin transport system permease protein HmuU n=1 Tax=Methylomusa anaerophila TaxID=1930071 RepID=A0A348ALE4_9FIRM|nr:iron ABC transporter permease [Methylomusa anaerophila]BBB91892.1 hemin transport system permease protein HmuU [Methylomusa anaerophila]HML88377.1 iron ABC transporter permease [Methylomusa anaerophila]
MLMIQIRFIPKQAIFPLFSLAALFVSLLLMLTIGTASIGFKDAVALLAKGMFNIPISEGIDPAYSAILLDIRWPRLVLAMLAGSGLAVSGACYQAMFNNPLGDPFILGISSGAALGAAIAIIMQHSQYLSLFAFLGGVVTIFTVYGLGRTGPTGLDSNRLLLAGVAFGSLLNALLFALMAINTRQVTEILFWIMGNLTNPVENLPAVAAPVLLGGLVIWVHARDLDIITTGDENAKYLGVDVSRIRIIILLATALVTGTVVSVCGVIGFIGLIVPHLVRKLAGLQHGTLLPLCAIWGAIFLLWADGLTRMVPALAQIPVGIVTAMFGSPFFLYILYLGGRGR